MGTQSNNGFRDKDTDGDCPNAAWPRSRCGRMEHHQKHRRRGLQIPVSCDSQKDDSTHLQRSCLCRLYPSSSVHSSMPTCRSSTIRADTCEGPSLLLQYGNVSIEHHPVQTPAKHITVFVADSCLYILL